MASSQPTIAGFYQCYKQPKAFLASVVAFRKHYPDSDLFIFSDGGFDYAEVSRKFNAKFFYEKKLGNGVTTLLNDREAFKIWLGRLFYAAQNAKEDYIIILEDDVKALRKVKSLKYDLNGVNETERIGPDMTAFLKSAGASVPKGCADYFYGGCGGSILKKDFILKNLNPVTIDSAVDDLFPHVQKCRSTFFPSDYWLTILTLYFGGKIGQYSGFCEKARERRVYPFKLLFRQIEILHQYKDLYNKELSPEEKELLGKFD